MAFLHAHSCECTKSELDLFTTPPTQTAIEDCTLVHYKPISSLTEESPVEFAVPGHGDDYVDLGHTMLHVTAELYTDLVRAENVAAPDVAPVNNLLHSLFNQVDITLNQKPVSPANNLYAYRAYLETLLNYGPAAKKSHLTSCLWYDDTPGKLDVAGDQNEGFKKRRAHFANKSTVDMIGHLHCDLFNQDRFLLNGVEMRLRLLRSRNEFCLMQSAGNDYKIRITSATLLVRRVKVSPGVLLGHAKALAKTTAKYPLTRVEVKSVTIAAGVQSETIDNIIHGQLPKRLVLGLVQNSAFSGDHQSNPFNFQHFNLDFLSLYVDGVQFPAKPFQPIFAGDKREYIDCYQTMFTGSGIHFLNEGNNISREDYDQGFCLFLFDLTPDLSAGENHFWNLIRTGSVRIEMRFATALTRTINALAFVEYDNILEIDNSRTVTTDYSG